MDFGTNRAKRGTNKIQKETDNMQTINRKYFARRGSGHSWRVAFRCGETGEDLKFLKGEFPNERDAIFEAELRNLTEDLRFHFKDFPEFGITVGDPSELWDKSKYARGRSMIVGAVARYAGNKRYFIPLFALGNDESAFARGVEFSEMVRGSRFNGFVVAPPKPEGGLTRYEVPMYDNICAVEARLNDAIAELMDAAGELEIARSKSNYDENTDALTQYQNPISEAIKSVTRIVDGDDFIEHQKGFDAFVASYGFARITNRMFDGDNHGKTDEQEQSFIDGYENDCNKDDGEPPIQPDELFFVQTARAQFPDADRDERRKPRDPEADEARAEQNFIGEILDEIEHVEPMESQTVGGISIDDAVDERGGLDLSAARQFSNDDE
jgi:hypothetical protein